MDYKVGDLVVMKKKHPCLKSEFFEIIRVGVDVKIRCLGCNHTIMLERIDFKRKLKYIVKKDV